MKFGYETGHWLGKDADTLFVKSCHRMNRLDSEALELCYGMTGATAWRKFTVVRLGYQVFTGLMLTVLTYMYLLDDLLLVIEKIWNNLGVAFFVLLFTWALFGAIGLIFWSLGWAVWLRVTVPILMLTSSSLGFVSKVIEQNNIKD
jgi:hypothetical protein